MTLKTRCVMNRLMALLTLAMITAIKFPAIFLGVLNVVLLNLSPAWKARATRDLLPRKRGLLTIFGGISLAAWITAISPGRLIAYW